MALLSTDINVSILRFSRCLPHSTGRTSFSSAMCALVLAASLSELLLLPQGLGGGWRCERRVRCVRQIVADICTGDGGIGGVKAMGSHSGEKTTSRCHSDCVCGGLELSVGVVVDVEVW